MTPGRKDTLWGLRALVLLSNGVGHATEKSVYVAKFCNNANCLNISGQVSLD